MSQPETAFFPSMKSLILNTHHLFTEPLLYYRAVTAVLPVLSRIFLLILTPMVVWDRLATDLSIMLTPVQQPHFRLPPLS